ncbi:bacteriophage antitermination protein Q [Sphingomonas trueperi]|uniref:bacteriophage antitermination protein Q n=1 Tax=Sphingomonas trueperi TaxID=53317 RepID=UPI0031E3A6CA
MLEAQDLAYMRRTVVYAHATPSPRRVSESDMPARFTDERYPERRHRAGPDRWAAEMKRSSTRLVASGTRPKPKSSLPLPPWAFEDSKVVAAIRTLPADYQHWLRYAYADSREWSDEQGVTVALWRRFEPTLGGAREKTRKACQGLVHLAAQCHKSRKNSGQVVHEPARIQELLGITRANWDKHWCPRWVAMHGILNQLDREALEALWSVTG